MSGEGKDPVANDLTEALREQILAAAVSKSPLCIRGGGSKDFYGNPPWGEVLATAGHSGIVAYEPTELVVTVRSGTPLDELEAVLAGQGQMLAFEPPHFSSAALGAATVGGCVAAGLSGPRRATAGSVRDFVLGIKMLDGRGEVLSFGGQVMKNVAGYDVSRLMAGAMGTLGLLLEVSLKVLPRPAAEATLRLEMSEDDAIEAMNRWSGQPLPISATSWERGEGTRKRGELTLRLSGARAAVSTAREKIGGDEVADGAFFWTAVREQTLGFFARAGVLWRLSVPSASAHLDLSGAQLIEWGGALRWLAGVPAQQAVREVAAAAGGHATLFRGPDRSDGAFQPLAAPLMKIHRDLKRNFDPQGLFNPGRLYADL